MTPTIHMLCGFIGSGKTAFAKKLEMQTNGFRLSTDAAMVALFGHNPPLPRDVYDDYHARVVALQRRYAIRLLSIGVDVIFESGFWQRTHRDELRAFAIAHGANFKMYYLQCPDTVMCRRAVARNENLNDETMFIEPATWDILRPLFEPPQDDEEFEIVVTG